GRAQESRLADAPAPVGRGARRASGPAAPQRSRGVPRGPSHRGREAGHCADPGAVAHGRSAAPAAGAGDGDLPARARMAAGPQKHTASNTTASVKSLSLQELTPPPMSRGTDEPNPVSRLARGGQKAQLW